MYGDGYWVASTGQILWLYLQSCLCINILYLAKLCALHLRPGLPCLKRSKLGLSIQAVISLVGVCPLDLYDIRGLLKNTVTLIFFIFYTEMTLT